MASIATHSTVAPTEPERGGLQPPSQPASRPPLTTRHWMVTGSGWLLTRAADGRASPAVAGQLTGGQAGMRIKIAPARWVAQSRLALTASLSSPLTSETGREASLGLAWRPTRLLPVTLIAERRIGLTPRTPSRFVALAAMGLSEQHLNQDWRLRGYAQAGVAGARRRDGFADGSLEIVRPVHRSSHAVLEAGTGAWAAIQPGVSRLDIGPRLDLVLPELPRPVRVSVQWRQRVAGHARPGSGPALVIGSDF